MSLAVLAMGLTVLPAAGQISVTTTADNTTAGDGTCTLREALINANFNFDITLGDCAAGVNANDTILFAIAPTGTLATIQPTSALPDIIEGVEIDGTTQGCAGTVPCIELDGLNAGAGADGLTIISSGSTIRGLVINRFENGIEISGAGATGNTIEGTYIGLKTNGVATHPNTGHGIHLLNGASNNTIGGTTAGARNVISGNSTFGVVIQGSSTTGNVVQGNYIGTDKAGMADLGNSFSGVYIWDSASSNTVGGGAAGAGNVISGNNAHGIRVDFSATGTIVQGNYIGTNATGASALGNTLSGISLAGGTSNNTVGGTAAGARNVISGNDAYGILVEDSGTTGNLIQGNYIGTDATGMAALGNSFSGVYIWANASSNMVGGAAAGAGNVISGNGNDGVRIAGFSTGNTIAGNYIGTDAGGTAPLGNTNSGIDIGAAASNNTVGGAAAGAGNVISGNGGDGIWVNGSGTEGNRISRNAIFLNTGLGIDLDGDGPTANDPGDPDAGPNRLQNTPVISEVEIDGSGNLIVTYAVDTDPANATYPLTVEFFETDVILEGERYLGSHSYTSGDYPGTVQVNLGTAATLGIGLGDGLVATATDADGNTSEFSAFHIVDEPGNLVVTSNEGNLTAGDGLCTLGEAITNANENSDTTSGDCAPGVDANDEISFSIYPKGTHQTISTSGLPWITEGVEIDATTQGCGGSAWCIELRGGGSIGGGFALSSASSTIRGFEIIDFYHGVEMGGAGTMHNVIEGNYIDNSLFGFNDAVAIYNGASNNTVGGTSAAARNIIRSRYNGVSIEGSTSTGNVIQGNYIGIDPTGTGALGSRFNGVHLSRGASDNVIGGTAPGAGNIISGNDENGILIEDSGTTGNLIQGNYIGTNATGTGALGNTNNGVHIRNGASGNTVGGTAAGAGNVISGNSENGILIEGSTTTGTLVQGNYIGTDPTGTGALGNTLDGVLLSDSTSDNIIGGTVPGAGNVISGNNQHGISITGNSATGNSTTDNMVQGNYIGTDATGMAAIGNTASGVSIWDSASGNTVGGTAAGARNIISGNGNDGVQIGEGLEFGLTADNVVQGNYIGTDATGTDGLGNGSNGIRIDGMDNTIGGTAAGAGNVISGNGSNGVAIITSFEFSARGNVLQGNYIGTDATGTSALANASNGVFLGYSTGSNTIGGSAAGGNTIAHNGDDGVECQDSVSNTISYNTISYNSDDGVTLEGHSLEFISSSNTVAHNEVSGNGGRGVAVHRGNSVATAKAAQSNFPRGNRISRNLFSGNTLLGIDLDRDGATPNDPGDADDFTWANRGQNYPEIASATINGSGDVVATYAVDTDPANATYPLTAEFFRADAGGQGEAFLGADAYTAADYNGCGAPPCEKTITFTPAAAVTSNDEVVATATDAGGNTSEFSLLAGPLPVELTAFTALLDGPAALLRWETASETNNAGFEVQYRDESMLGPTEINADAPWTALTFVEGHGTTPEPHTYTFRAEDLAPGRHRFRLKQIDYDGAFTYAPEVQVHVRVQGSYLLTAVYPNPFQRRAHFRLAVATEQPVRIEVFNLQGQRAALLHDGVLAAGITHPFTLDGGGLSSGTYVYRVTGTHFAAGGSMTLVK